MSQQYKLLPTDLVKDPARPLRSNLTPESVNELVESIRQVGIIEPLIVNQTGKTFEVIAGHRRLLAAEIAGLTVIPAIIKDVKGMDAEILKVHENLARQSINAVDWAKHLAYLKTTYGLADDELGKMLGMSRVWVIEHLAILNWAPEMIEAVRAGKLAFSSGRELAGIKDDNKRRVYTDSAIKGGITPTLAKRWKLEANTPAIQYPDNDRTPDASSNSPLPPEINPDCPVCGLPVPLSELVTISIHHQCRPAPVIPTPETTDPAE